MLLCNVGDVMERWTNGEYRATLHRVAVPPEGSDERSRRVSLVYFQNPDEIFEQVQQYLCS